MIGEYEKAPAAFDKAILGDPKYGKALFGKALTLKNIQRYQEGLDLCNKKLDFFSTECILPLNRVKLFTAQE
jgi:tetratricopeptide (TPR) repeat protein